MGEEDAPENLDSERSSKWNATALSTWSKIDTFFAGIFFTCIVLLLQRQEQFKGIVNLLWFEFSLLHLMSVPLVLSFLFFMFGAIFFADACASLRREVETCGMFFTFFGFLLSNIALFFILLNISIEIAFFGSIIGAVFLLLWVIISYRASK